MCVPAPAVECERQPEVARRVRCPVHRLLAVQRVVERVREPPGEDVEIRRPQRQLQLGKRVAQHGANALIGRQRLSSLVSLDDSPTAAVDQLARGCRPAEGRQRLLDHCLGRV